jgi:hypothetical protein
MFHAIHHRSRSVYWRLCLTCCCFVAFGCGDETLDYSEVKRIKEKVTESELQSFLRIIEALPEKKLPKFPTVFAPPPDWKTSRTLPVKQLIQEEAKLIDERWNEESLARNMQRKRKLQRLLRRERMTSEQFIGLSLTIGVALSRNTLRDNQNLKAILKKGDKALEPLRHDDRPFASLTPEETHSVLQQSVWVTRIDRAERLSQVPPENIALVRKHWEKLAKIFPAPFTENPLDAVADLLEERGLPFEELFESGADAEIEWIDHQALIGHDTPDTEFQ